MLFDPFKSVIDFKFYRGVPDKSFGATVLYIAYLGIFFGIAIQLAMFTQVRPKLNEAVEWAATSIPRLTLAEGKLSSSAEGPVEVRHPQIPELALVVDIGRTDAVTPAEMQEGKWIAYLTENTVYVLNNKRLETYDVAKAESKEMVVLDEKFYRTLGKTMSMVLYPISMATSLIVFFFWKHASALIYSLLALLINAFMNANLEFPALYKLAVYAQTPVVALQILLIFLPKIPFFTFLALLLVGVYLWQAIRQIAPPPEVSAA